MFNFQTPRTEAPFTDCTFLGEIRHFDVWFVPGGDTGAVRLLDSQAPGVWASYHMHSFDHANPDVVEACSRAALLFKPLPVVGSSVTLMPGAVPHPPSSGGRYLEGISGLTAHTTYEVQSVDGADAGVGFRQEVRIDGWWYDRTQLNYTSHLRPGQRVRCVDTVPGPGIPVPVPGTIQSIDESVLVAHDDGRTYYWQPWQVVPLPGQHAIPTPGQAQAHADAAAQARADADDSDEAPALTKAQLKAFLAELMTVDVEQGCRPGRLQFIERTLGHDWRRYAEHEMGRAVEVFVITVGHRVNDTHGRVPGYQIGDRLMEAMADGLSLRWEDRPYYRVDSILVPGDEDVESRHDQMRRRLDALKRVTA